MQIFQVFVSEQEDNAEKNGGFILYLREIT